MNAQICITGIGIRSAIGNSPAGFADSLRKGVSGVREQAGIFPNKTIWAGLVREEVGCKVDPAVDRAAMLAVQAACAAWSNAIPGEKPDGGRVALVLGTSHGGRSQIDYCLEQPDTFETGEAAYRILEVSPHFRQTEFVARRLGINGPVATISTACSSSSAAILYGMDLLQSHKVDFVLTGGMDGFSKLTHAGFRALGAISDGACGPFSERIGISLGEGAAVIVLERLEDALRRDAPIWAELYGGGSSWDCYHITEPEPSGEGLLRALEMAAVRGQLPDARKLCYANLHGTGTRANDAAETIALKRFFGDSPVPPASSVKSFTGHTLGASGAMGLIASILGMKNGFLPPTANFGGGRAGCDLDYVPNDARPSEIQCFSAQSAGFGGVNVVLMGGRRRQRNAAPAEPEASIALTGVGVVSAAGIGCEVFRESLLAGRTGIAPIERFATSGGKAVLAGLVREFQPRKLAPTLNLRRADLCFQFAAVAVSEALASSQIMHRGVDRSQIGLVVGTTRGAVSSFEQSMTSAMGGCWEKTGPSHFPNLVMSSLGGFVSKMFDLRGAASTLVCGTGGGLQVIVHAFEMLRRNATQRAVVVVLADELSPLFFRLLGDSARHSPDTFLGEGAAAFVLERCPQESDGFERTYISGSGMTFDSDSHGNQRDGAWLAKSVREALKESGFSPGKIDLIYGNGSLSPHHLELELRELSQVFDRSIPFSSVLRNTGLAESASAGFSLVAAALTLRHGEAYPLPIESTEWNFVGGQALHSDFRIILLTGTSDAGNNAALILSKHATAGKERFVN